jgi:hypothetical protein
VENLINQPHGIEITSFNRLLWEMDQIATSIHPVCEFPYGSEIGKNHIPAQRKKGLIEFIIIS